MKAMKHKTKISILWTIFAVSASAAMITWFIEPGILDQIMSKGELATEKLNTGKSLLFALWWLIPLSMAFLTQIFEHTLNRWTNLIVSIAFTLFTIYYFINLLINGWFAIANLLILTYSFVTTILIACYAWNLPKEST